MCSDEIYCDFILESGKIYIFVGWVSELENNSVMLMVVSKIFNVVGFGMLFVVILDVGLCC